jgi:cyclophilin family peptidyl-prolyl cis-trans isomerase/HEAT repeat protein
MAYMKLTSPLVPILLLLIVLGCTACLPPAEKTFSEEAIDWRNPTFQRIINFQDQRLVDSLEVYLQHPDPAFRYLAARAFGSFRDSSVIDLLAPLLRDPFNRVRTAAAFSIGQQGVRRGGDVLVAAFAQEDTAMTYGTANREILIGVGRSGAAPLLQDLSTIQSYTPQDTLLLEGQAWGIYHYALRGITEPAGTQRMLDLLTNVNYPASVRLIAANYLMRSQIQLDSLLVPTLIDTYTEERDPRVRMAVALSLGYQKRAAARDVLSRSFARERDWRVRVNILRGLGRYPYPQVRDVFFEALRDRNPNVAKAAADQLLANGNDQDASFYWRLGRDSFPAEIQLTLYQAANRHLPYYFAELRDGINFQLRQRLTRAADPYERAGVIAALAEFPWNYRYIQQNGFVDSAAVVRSAAVRALGTIAADAEFSAFFGLSARRVTRELATYLRQAVETADPGMAYEAALALRHPDRAFGTVLDSLEFIRRTLDRLTLPRETETYYALEQTLAFLTGAEAPAPAPPAFNHPIDWSVLERFETAPRLRIETAKGSLTLELWPDRAPGTVATMVQLAGEGFFNGKPFHRVVPNFVAQGGDPRGDGFGGADFTIRTEVFPFQWATDGIIGMASAGLDTESVQFFLTHSPTPHLSGNYTAFGRLLSGEEVLANLRVGDRIESFTVQ